MKKIRETNVRKSALSKRDVAILRMKKPEKKTTRKPAKSVKMEQALKDQKQLENAVDSVMKLIDDASYFGLATVAIERSIRFLRMIEEECLERIIAYQFNQMMAEADADEKD